MRPCEFCGHPMPNNLKECPECGRVLSQSLSGLTPKASKPDRATEPPEREDSIVMAVSSGVILIVPPLVLYLCVGRVGVGPGLLISMVLLAVCRQMMGR
jgi:hypothetical protein